MNKYIFLSVLTMALISCGKSKPSRSIVDASEMKEIVLTNDSTIYVQDWVQNVEVVPLETTGKVLVGSVDGVIATDSNFIVYDKEQAKSVFVFGRDGKHRATISRSGHGPQEYIGLAHVALLPDNQTLVIYDNWGQKVLYFSLDGRFISSTPAGFWFSEMEYLNENQLVYGTYGAGDDDPGLQEYENRTDLLYFADANFEIRGSTLPPRYKNRALITPKIWKSGEQVYVHRPHSDTIYQALPNSLKAIYRLDITPIGGESNFHPDTTPEDFKVIFKNTSLFIGKFIESGEYIFIGIRTPPRGTAAQYLYSKRSGKSYKFEENTKNIDDVLLWFLSNWPNTSLKDRFVGVVEAYSLETVGYIDREKRVLINAITQRPELAHLTRDSNPVVILYNFKEGL